MPENEEASQEQQGNPVMLIVFLAMLAGAVGLGLGVGLGTAGAMQPADPNSDDLGPLEEEPEPDPGEGYQYVDFDSITVTLNTPRAERFLRATLRFKCKQSDLERLTTALEKYRPDLTSQLIKYLTNLTPGEIRGEENVNRVCREVRQMVNELLWPQGRGRVEEVLLAEWTAQ